MCFALAKSVKMGMGSAASAVQYFTDNLNPRFIAMVGFSAGNRGRVNLGDVIVPCKVYSYGTGKQTSASDILPEIDMHQIDYLWQQKVERFDSDWRNSITLSKPISYEKQIYVYLKKMFENDYTLNIIDLHNNSELPDINMIIKDNIKQKYVVIKDSRVIATKLGKEKYNNDYLLNYSAPFEDSQPKVKVGVLATGENVQQWSGIFEQLEKEYDRKTCAIDMESYAILDVAKFNHIPCIIAKGIGDFANDGKAFDNRYIEYSVFSAYRFIISFFNTLTGKELLNR